MISYAPVTPGSTRLTRPPSLQHSSAARLTVGDMAYPFRPCTLPNANPRLPKRVLASQTVTQRAGRNYGSDLDCIPRSERFTPTAAHRDNQGVPSRHLQISLHQRDPGTGFRTAGTSIVDCRWSPDCRSHVARFAASPYYWFAKNVWRAWMRRPHEVHACAGSRSGSIAGGTCGTFRRGHRPTSLNSLQTPKRLPKSYRKAV